MTYLVALPFKEYTRLRLCDKGEMVSSSAKIWTITTPKEHKIFYKTLIKALNPYYIGGMMATSGGALYSLNSVECISLIQGILGLDDEAHNASLNKPIHPRTYQNIGTGLFKIGITTFKLVRLITVFTTVLLAIPLMFSRWNNR